MKNDFYLFYKFCYQNNIYNLDYFKHHLKKLEEARNEWSNSTNSHSYYQSIIALILVIKNIENKEI